MELWETLKNIEAVDLSSMENAKKRLDGIAKPLHSLGKLEDLLIQIAGIQRTEKVQIKKRALLIMCSDNGVVEEGVTQTGSEVTAIVANNFLQDNSCACIMAKGAKVDVFPLDVGMKTDTLVEKRKVAYGTKNMRKTPAMTREEAITTIETGIAFALEKKQLGYQMLATGEMGIGNTTTSSALASVLLQLPVEEVTGKGAGLSDAGLLCKCQVIKDALALHKPNPKDPIDVLCKVGGFDIAALCGIYIGAAYGKMPVVMDGFISSVAALLAVRLEPKIKAYLLPSHVSKEPAGKKIMEALEKEPCLHCDMCLGEGTGAVALFPLLDMALDVYERMSTFSQIDVEAYVEL